MPTLRVRVQAWVHEAQRRPAEEADRKGDVRARVRRNVQHLHRQPAEALADGVLHVRGVLHLGRLGDHLGQLHHRRRVVGMVRAAGEGLLHALADVLLHVEGDHTRRLADADAQVLGEVLHPEVHELEVLGEALHPLVPELGRPKGEDVVDEHDDVEWQTYVSFGRVPLGSRRTSRRRVVYMGCVWQGTMGSHASWGKRLHALRGVGLPMRRVAGTIEWIWLMW